MSVISFFDPWESWFAAAIRAFRNVTPETIPVSPSVLVRWAKLININQLPDSDAQWECSQNATNFADYPA
jgi:hypothetical protein